MSKINTWGSIYLLLLFFHLGSCIVLPSDPDAALRTETGREADLLGNVNVTTEDTDGKTTYLETFYWAGIETIPPSKYVRHVRFVCYKYIPKIAEGRNYRHRSILGPPYRGAQRLPNEGTAAVLERRSRPTKDLARETNPIHSEFSP
ncbi:hypothetical protein BDP27DRAFT_714404 [Rhodocollybia butyracea]|uniref:Uncharacterized protein n=1 Tax=Rhodocollybia butyracea TaxID=206335 RepID=A0A9P5Q876_9AGAR|nr:hypothetical protein BDP27DRAFT_714404 [Rhodocollybia butyracea]